MEFRLENISKYYTMGHRRIDALRDVSLCVRAGELITLGGASGSGKSTLLMILGGLEHPDEGRVGWGEMDPYQLSTAHRAARRAEWIGFVFQQFHLIPYLTVLDNVRTGAIGLPSRLAAGNAEGSSPAITRRATELLAQLQLSDRLEHRPDQLSVGERQRVAMARAVLNGPRLILADEPTGNLDPENARIVLDSLRRYAQEGAAVCLVTHDTRADVDADQRYRVDTGRLSCETTTSPLTAR